MNIDKVILENPKPVKRRVWISILLTFLGGGLPLIYCGKFKAGILLEIALFLTFIVLESLLAVFADIRYMIIMLLIGLVIFIALIIYNIRVTRDTNAALTPWRKNTIVLLVSIFIALTIANYLGSILTDRYTAEAYSIPTKGMEPTLIVEDFLYARKNVSLDDLRRGDIIIFKYPNDPTENYVKRLIAVPGDKIKIDDKQVYLNGTLLDEPYIEHVDNRILPFYNSGQGVLWGIGSRDNMPEIEVPQGNLFVLGDNRDNSADSRFWGYVPDSLLLGKANFIYLSWDSDSSRVRWDRIGMRLDEVVIEGGGHEEGE